MIGSTNPNASNVMLEVFQESDPWYVVIREAIRDHRAEEREPVSMGSNPNFLCASGDRRRLMIFGPSRMYDPEDGQPCPECDHPFGDDWEYRKLPSGPHIGETWLYTCPGCGHETAEVST